MTNITLKLDEALLREVRALAAERGTSVSRLVTLQLEKLVREDKRYDQAQRRASSRLDKGFDLEWTPPEDRDELRERHS